MYNKSKALTVSTSYWRNESDTFEANESQIISNSDQLIPIYQIYFQEHWSIYIIHTLPDNTLSHIFHQLHTNLSSNLDSLQS